MAGYIDPLTRSDASTRTDITSRTVVSSRTARTNNIYYVDNSFTVNGDGSTINQAATSGGAGAFNSVGNMIAKSGGFLPGSTILLKRGQIFREDFTVPSHGTLGNSITFDSYGVGDKPVISGSDLYPEWFAYPGNYFRNPGFEKWNNTGDMAYFWNKTESGSSKFYSESTIVHRGGKSLKLSVDSSNSTASFRQIIDIKTVASTEFTFSFWYKMPSAKTVQLNIRDYGNSGWYLLADGSGWQAGAVNIALTGNGDWQQYTIIFTTLTGSPNFYALLTITSAASSDLYFDDFSLAPTATADTKVWGCAKLSAVPATGFNKVWFNNKVGTSQTSIANMTADYDWYFDTTLHLLWVYSSTDVNPSTIYTGIEALTRYSVITNDKNYITFKNLTVDKSSKGLHGAYSANIVNQVADNITATRNYAAGMGIGRTATPSSFGGENCMIKNCTFHENGHLDLTNQYHALYVGHSRNITIQDCNFSNQHDGYNIQLQDSDGWVTNSLIQRNLLIGGGTATSGGGIVIYNNATGLTSENIIRNNIIVNPKCIGISIGGTATANFVNYIYNNTIYIFPSTTSVYSFYKSNDSTAILRNNIFYGGKFYSNSAVAPDSDYNIIGPDDTNCIYWVATNYSTLAAYVAASSVDTHSLSLDPLVFDKSKFDFHLLPNSPAIDKGVAITGITKDYDNKTIPQRDSPCIGAFEFPKQ